MKIVFEDTQDVSRIPEASESDVEKFTHGVFAAFNKAASNHSNKGVLDNVVSDNQSHRI